MLTTLRIKNLALVSDLTLELQPGYNVITGETGAGKSILIGALDLVLGERADRTLIRSGTESCSVEAAFDVCRLQAPLGTFLENNGLEPCQENQLLVKRTFTNAGVNRQFINGSPTTLTALSTVGDWLVDIHGPHEHQSLLNSSRQLAMLDAFGGLEKPREAFAELVRRRAELIEEKASLVVDDATYAQQLDLLRYQVSEISNAQLRPGEEDETEQEYRRASNAAKLLEIGQAALEGLSEAETSLFNQAGSLGRMLQELKRLDPAAGSLVDLHEQGVSLWRDLQTGLSHYVDRVEVEPARLRELEQRLDLLQSLKRKYGPTIANVIEFGEQAQRRLRELEGREEVFTRLNAALARLASELHEAGRALSTKRRSLLPQLSKAVTRELSQLGFKQSCFSIALETANDTHLAQPAADSDTMARLSTSGFDRAEFQFAPNPGEPARSLRAVASSGELARVMLALKTVLAAEDQIPVLVFDEVDANVGGETANAIGEKMRRISQKRQVLCITHLPQVAAPASAHYVASKRVTAGRTTSSILLVTDEARVTELARMLGGQTEAARKHAEALLQT
jgi:DNA repair protein RecN (Recombination protein N)